MKLTMAILAICGGLMMIPVRTIADATSPALSATMLCRPEVSGEKPTAMMGSTGIVCKSMPKVAINQMGPNTTGMSGAAATAAWRRWLSQTMSVPQILGGGAGG
jgi:hypothetical protein